jgi:WD40 repeat protein
VAGYDLLGELGRGGMGVVYRARQRALNRVVALKMVLAGDHASTSDLARFRQEAEAVAHLHHPHIVQIYEVGEQNGRPFFSLEFIGGGSLAQRLAGNPQPPRAAAALIETLARTMHFAHQRGIIHRDLKPANVLLTPEGMPKITDFGLAKRLEQDTGNTRTGAVLGTPSYIAPEQAAGKGREIGPAVDVYALGAILYELLTGRPPFKGETSLDTMLQVMSEEPVPPTRLQPKVPRDLETICLKCLQKDPRKRYPTAQALADDLKRFLAGEPIVARPTGVLERSWKWMRRRPTVAALLLVCVLGALALLGGSVWISRREHRRAEEAERQRQIAEQLRTRAEEEQQKARKAEQAAREAEQRAHFQLEHSRRSLYALQLTQVAGCWQRDPARGIELLRDLDRCPEKWRDFAWHFLYRLCQRHRGNLAGHDKPVTAVAFAPDGKTLATASWDSTVILWNLGSWRAGDAGPSRTVLKGHAGTVLAVAFSPDGKLLATAGEDQRIKVWDRATSRELAALDGHTHWVKTVAFAPDSRTLASGSIDGTIRLWEATRPGGASATYEISKRPVTSLAFSPDGQTLAVGSEDQHVRFWDVKMGKKRREFRAHDGAVNAVAFAPDGAVVASAGADCKVKVWDAASARERLVIAGHQRPVYSLAYSRDGKVLASGSADGMLKLWQPITGEERLTLHVHPANVVSLAFAPDGRTLVTGLASPADNVKLWDVDAAPEWATLRAATRPGYTIALAPGGKLLATALSDKQVNPLENNKVKLWDPSRPRGILLLRRDPLKANALVFAPDGRQLAVAEEGGAVTLWDITTGEERLPALQGRHATSARCVAFAPDGKTLASGGDDRTVKLWQVATGKLLATLEGHEQCVTSVAFAPDGKTVASSSDDRTIRLWDVSTSRCQATLASHKQPVNCVAFSPDGKTVASAAGAKDNANHPGEVCLWDVSTGKVRVPLQGHTRAVRSLAFTADGKTLATGSDDRTIKLWDAATGQERATLQAHGDAVHAVAFSGDGQLLASASMDGTVKLWLAAKSP